MSGVEKENIGLVIDQIDGEKKQLYNYLYKIILFWWIKHFFLRQINNWWCTYLVQTNLYFFAEDLTQSNMVDATNWEGEVGGQGIRALTRYENVSGNMGKL